MSNLPEMSARARQALEVLAEGGRFSRVLERGYHGREQWQYRLSSGKSWGVVKGVGIKAFYELQELGFLQYAHEERSSVREVYKLRKE